MLMSQKQNNHNQYPNHSRKRIPKFKDMNAVEFWDTKTNKFTSIYVDHKGKVYNAFQSRQLCLNCFTHLSFNGNQSKLICPAGCEEV